MKNKTLNILKAVSAILIVFNHCKFPGTFGILMSNYARIGVPIFFMISGYFVYNNNIGKIKKKIIHILKILLISCIFWFLFNIIRYALLEKNLLVPYLKNFISLKNIIKFFVFNENFFWGHLWFINALLYCYLWQFLIKKFNIENYRYESYLVIILLIVYQLMNAFVINENLSNIYLIRNFIFVGIPFFDIGKLINHFKLDKYIKIKYSIFFVIFIIFTVEILTYVNELYICSIILSIYLFLFCLKKPNIEQKHLEYIGDKLNLYIYVLHPAIKYVVIYVYNGLNFNSNILMYLQPIIVLIVTIIISYCYYSIYEKINSKKIINS